MFQWLKSLWHRLTHRHAYAPYGHFSLEYRRGFKGMKLALFNPVWPVQCYVDKCRCGSRVLYIVTPHTCVRLRTARSIRRAINGGA